VTEIKFSCPHCSQHLEAPPEMFGAVIACPSCDKQIQVPQPRQASTPPPLSRPIIAEPQPLVALPRPSVQESPPPARQASHETQAPRRESLVATVLCALTSHRWNGCTCLRCGRTCHQWSPDHDGCLRCGQVIGISCLEDLVLFM